MVDGYWTQLADDLRKPDAKVLFVTGAGISLASGIPTFRGTDPDAVWANDVEEKGTRRHFDRNPVSAWQWYLDRFEMCLRAEPNEAHRALTTIERRLVHSTVITQNIDGLHLKAGTKNLIEIHGSARKIRCSRRGCKHGAPKGTMDWDPELFAAFRETPKVQNLPRCPSCRKILRAHVLWFDENYADHRDYGIDRALKAFDDPTVLVFVGTSFAVSFTDFALNHAKNRGIRMYSVDPARHDQESLFPIWAKAEDLLPWLAEEIR